MTITIEKFEELCAAHDWTYPMTDDYRKFEKGRDNECALQSTAETYGPAYLKVFKKHSELAWEGIL